MKWLLEDLGRIGLWIYNPMDGVTVRGSNLEYTCKAVNRWLLCFQEHCSYHLKKPQWYLITVDYMKIYVGILSKLHVRKP